MITGAIMGLIGTVLHYTVGALPTSPGLPLNSDAVSVVDGGFFNHLGWANNYFPVSDALDGIVVVLSLLVIMTAVRVGIWALSKVDVLGGD